MLSSLRREPRPAPSVLDNVSPDTAAYFENAARIERERNEFEHRIEQLEHQLATETQNHDQEVENLKHAQAEVLAQQTARYRVDLAQRDARISALQHELDVAEAKRDGFAVRALEAETVLRTVSATIVESAERARVNAAAMGEQPEPPRGREGAEDLDQPGDDGAPVPQFLTRPREDEQS